MLGNAGTPGAVRPLVTGLFFVSGATGLVYETIWLRQLVLLFGSTLHATTAILSVFMGGLALGAWLGGRFACRARTRPLVAYGLLEIALGGYALLVPRLLEAIEPAMRLLWEAGGRDLPLLLSAGKLVGIVLVLLPPTAFMGATLPVLSREIAHGGQRFGGQIGTLYSVNTLGAVAGTALAGLYLLPTLGMSATLSLAAAANWGVGGLALALAAGSRRPAPGIGDLGGPPSSKEKDRASPTLLAAFALSGAAAMTLEVAWTRGLSLVFGSSVYAFALMLVAFLSGLGFGSAAFSALLRRGRREAAVLLAALLGGAGVAALATAWILQFMPSLFGRLYLAAPFGPGTWLAVQLGIALLVMLPTTFLLGGVFPAVIELDARKLEGVPRSVGRSYGANTLGTIAGALAGGFLFVPALGVAGTILLAAALELALGLVVSWKLVPGSPGRRLPLVAGLAAGLVLVGVARPGWDTLLMNSGVYVNLQEFPVRTWKDYLERLRGNNRIVYAREGLTASVLVADHLPSGSRYLSVNGKIEASSRADLETQILVGHLPLLLHREPRDVLVIGLASGITIGSVATHPVRRVDVVEVERAMIEAARLFSEVNGNVLEDPRVVLRVNDARNELQFDRSTYDVIISEPSNPWMTVASNLFTKEFFELVRGRLRPGGVFCQWVQAYSLRAEDLRSILAAFHHAFPRLLVFETLRGVDLLLIGSAEPVRLDLAQLERRMAELKVQMDLRRVGVRRPSDLLALFRLGDLEAGRILEGATPNTDDNGRVEFSAPLALYLDTIEENLALLDSAGSDPLAYLDPAPASREEADRLLLVLASKWKERGHEGLALAAATRLAGGPFAAEARQLMEGRSR